MPNIEKIKSYLSHRASNVNLAVYNCVTSTNDLAKETVQKNNYVETVIIARKQTAGRGRRGRSFFSPDGTGIYISIALRPACSAEIFSLVTSAAAVAVTKSIEKVSGKNVDIKWINDIFLNGKKICGILCETTFDENMTPCGVVVGIGINLCDPEGGFPTEISNIASSLFGISILDEEIPSKLCAEIINNLLVYTDTLEERLFINEYKSKLFVLGKEISVITPQGNYNAIATDIDNDAHLIVTLPDKSTRVLNAGEISIKPYQTK